MLLRTVLIVAVLVHTVVSSPLDTLPELATLQPCTAPDNFPWYRIKPRGAIDNCYITDDETTPGMVAIYGTTSGIDSFEWQAEPQEEYNLGFRQFPEFGYTFKLQSRCWYTVTVTSRETDFNTPGTRLFNVYANDVLIDRNVDVYARSGFSRVTPWRGVYNVSAPYGVITLVFSGQPDSWATVSEVQIDDGGCDRTVPPPSIAPPRTTCRLTPTPPSASATSVALINAGGRDMCGYSADRLFAGGVARDVSGVTSDVLRSWRWGLFNYTVPVTPGRRYHLKLVFSEGFWTAPFFRQFNVYMNGDRIATYLDIYAMVDSRFKAYTVEVRNWTAPAGIAEMLLQFTIVKDAATVSAIELWQLS